MRAGILQLAVCLSILGLVVQPADAASAPCFITPPASIAPEIGVGGFPSAVATGDFNRDGKLDFLTATGSVGEGSVSVRLGNGHGGFTSGANVTVGANPSGLAVGDFNGDDRLDFVTANLGSQTVSVRIGNGQGGFAAPSTPEVGIGGLPISIAVGDFNKDGHLDFITGNYTSQSVSVRLGNGQGLFSAPSTPETAVPGKTVYGVVVGDFNENGQLDAIIAGPNGITELFGSGDGNFSNKEGDLSGVNIKAILVADFDGDNHLDLVLAKSDINTIYLGFGIGIGAFDSEKYEGPPSIFVVGADPRALATGDFNADGKLDFAVANFGANTVSVRLAEGNGKFTAVPDVVVGSQPVALAAGLFDGDNGLDLIVANRATLNVSIRKNTCIPNAAPVVTVPGSQTVQEDGALLFSVVTGNKITVSDPDAGDASIDVQLAVSRGTLTLGGTSQLTFSTGDGALDRLMAFSGSLNATNAALNGLIFKPEPNVVEPTQLTITVNDRGTAGTAGAKTTTSTVGITIVPVNDAPVATNDHYTVSNVIPLTVQAPGLLANDTDIDTNPSAFRASLVAGPKSGTLQLNPSGGFTYAANPGFVGTDTFTYRTQDDTLFSNDATVTLSVTSLGCTPQPKIQSAAGGGKLQVHIEATPVTGPQPNALLAIQYGAFQNARVTVNGQRIESGQAIKPASGALAVDFAVERLDPTKPAQVPFTVLDGCGQWQTFVGGGVGAGF